MKIILSDNGLRALVNFRIDVIRHFLESGYEVTIVYPRSTREESLIKLLPAKCRVIENGMKPSGTSLLDDFKLFLEYVSIYKKEKPDIVFHYTIKPNIYGNLAAKLLGVQSVDMVAGLGYMFNSDGFAQRLGRAIYRFGTLRAKRVFVLNQSNYASLLKYRFCKQKNLILLKGGEGVNLDLYKYVENKFDTTRFLMVARILYDKGYSEYVDAAEIVKSKYPDIEISLLGPLDENSPMGVSKEVLKRDVDNGKIDYLGVSNDVPSIVGRDGVVVVVVSSYHEGLNRALMEATAMGRPVITTDTPGCRETVDEGKNGLLVPVKDSKALAEAMIKIIELPQESKQSMARRSYEKAKRDFDVGNVLKVYDNVISELCG